jgi:hypothetical protein
MSEQSTLSGDQWLSVSACASALGVSERQARRYAGRLTPDDRRDAGHMAGHEAGHMTGALVRLSAMQKARFEAKGRTPDTQSTLRPDATPDMGPDVSSPHAGHGAGRHDRDAQSTLSAHQAEEIKFLRAQLEARDRDAAELRAALREALRAMPKAIEQSTLLVGSNEANSANSTAQSTLSGDYARAPEIVAQTGATGKRAQSTLGRDSVGLRGWLLKVLKG